MNYQEKFEINIISEPYFSNQFDILITGFLDPEDKRHMHFRNRVSNFRGKIFSFDTCEFSEKLHYKIETHDGTLINKADDKSLIPDLETLLRREGIQGSNICIDITALKQGILFLLTTILINKVQPARFFAAYTEPFKYKKRNNIQSVEQEEFDLYDRIVGSSTPVPGFTKPQSTRPILLIAPIGFDSKRLHTIYESLKPKCTIPVVGFPSFIPGWDLTAIKANYLILRSAECFDMVRTCEAASPFEMYNLINEEFHRNNSRYDIYISPLGTRPHCLGAALFVSKNKSAYLIYDFPIEKKYRSEDVLKANIYNLSKYIS